METKWRWRVLVLLSMCALLNSDESASYDGYKVYRVSVNNVREACLMGQWKGHRGYDFWTEIDLNDKCIIVAVNMNHQYDFERFLHSNGLIFSVFTDEIMGFGYNNAKLIYSNCYDKPTKRSPRGADISRYMNYHEIVHYIESLDKFTHPYTGEVIAQTEVIGSSFEEKQIYMVKISSDHSRRKPIILLEAGMHAREWSSPATVIFLIQQFVENFTSTADILKYVDYYIIPVVNPDGYEYSRDQDRFWRKTRSDQGKCKGVDGNRNFDFFWGIDSRGNFPCSDTYQGPKPFSEPETRSIKRLGYKYRRRILAYLAIHSYGAYFLYPWGYSNNLPVQWEKLDECAHAFTDTLKQNNGTAYKVGSSGTLLYTASGGSDDWFLGVLNVPFAYTIELPSEDQEGFEYPEGKLKGLGMETLEGMRNLTHCFVKSYDYARIKSITEDYIGN